MTAASPSNDRFDFGRVFSHTFRAIGRNPVSLLVCVLVLGLIPSMVSLLGQAWIRDLHLSVAKNLAAIQALSLISVALYAVFQVTCIRVATEDMEGRRPGVVQLLAVAFRTSLPAMGLMMLINLAILAGSLLLVVPGLIVMVIWSVALPALTTEHVGVPAALSRSRTLTKDHRWSVFGAMLLLILMTAGPGVIVSLMTGGFTPTGDKRYVLIALHAAVAALLAPIGSVGHGEIYLELRRLKGGFAPDTAAVFD